MSRPRSLSHDQIADAALRVIDRDGLGALSMRAVAEELGVGTMSLYRYVESREQVEGILVDRVVGVVDPAVSPRASWSKRVTTLTLRVRGAVAAHPAIVPLLLIRRHQTLGSLQWGEAVLRALADGGLAGRERVVAFRTLLAYTMGAVQAEHFGPLAGEGTTALADLPRADYPNLTDAATHAKGITAEDEFRRGLDVVLRGLGAAVG